MSIIFMFEKYKYFLNGFRPHFLYIFIVLFVTGSPSGEHDSPTEWPMDWRSGIIPYALNFFSPNPKRLLGLVKNGLAYMENNSCLRFEEQDPVKAAQLTDFTYLYFTYSGVVEDCCLKYYYKDIGRRTVLITPVCSNPAEVAHATLHGLGLTHPPGEPFIEEQVTPMTQGWCDYLLRATRIQNIMTSKQPIKESIATSRSFHHRWVGLGPNHGLRMGANTSIRVSVTHKRKTKKRKNVFKKWIGFS